MENEWDIFIKNYIENERIKHDSLEFSSLEETTLPNGLLLTLRLEREDDYREVEELTRRAFWAMWPDNFEKLGGIGCDEHYLCHSLRTSPEFIPQLDFVAVHNGRIAGNIMFTAAYVRDKNGKLYPVLNFGPLSVLPEYRKTGVGGALMHRTINVSKKLGYDAILFFGHLEYYPKFGFIEAKEFGIKTSWGDNFPAFMGMELSSGYLRSIGGGNFVESPLMHVDDDAAREFDKSFSPIPREPEIMSINEIHLPFIHRLMNIPEILKALHERPTPFNVWEEAIKTWQNDNYEVNFIVYSDAKPVGWLKLNGFDGKNKAWIFELIISPEYQYKGFGTFALKYAQNYIRSRGFSRVALHTDAGNTAAISLYEKQGFVLTAIKQTKGGDGLLTSIHTYEKEL